MAHTNNILVKSTSLAFLSSFFDRIYIEVFHKKRIFGRIGFAKVHAKTLSILFGTNGHKEVNRNRATDRDSFKLTLVCFFIEEK